jgi:hypothetical protein
MAVSGLRDLAGKVLVTPEAEGPFRLLPERLHGNLAVTQVTCLAVLSLHGSMNDLFAEILKPVLVALQAWFGHKPPLRPLRAWTARGHQNSGKKQQQQANQNRPLIHPLPLLSPFVTD